MTDQEHQELEEYRQLGTLTELRNVLRTDHWVQYLLPDILRRVLRKYEDDFHAHFGAMAADVIREVRWSYSVSGGVPTPPADVVTHLARNGRAVSVWVAGGRLELRRGDGQHMVLVLHPRDRPAVQMQLQERDLAWAEELCRDGRAVLGPPRPGPGGGIGTLTYSGGNSYGDRGGGRG